MDRAMQRFSRHYGRSRHRRATGIAQVPMASRFNAFQTRLFATTEHNEVESIMKRLLQKSSSWAWKDWRDSEGALFNRAPISRDTIHWSFQLLDRMAREAQHETSFVLTTKHINQVVDRWRIGTRHRGVVDPKQWSAVNVLTLVENYAKRIPSLRLNTKTYSMIMAVKIKQDPTRSPSLCTTIIERMNKSTATTPNAVALTYLMDAHVQSMQANAVFATQSIFDFLMEKANESPDLIPNDKSLTRVLQAWVSLSNATVEEALPHMERNIHFLVEASQFNPEILSDSTFLDVVLEDCSKRGKSNASLLLADALLEHVLRLSVEHPHLLPFPKTFSRIIFLWRDSDLCNSAVRAQFWLDEMCRLSLIENRFESPRHTVYGAVIAAWAKSNLEEAPQRAEDVWHRMVQDIARATTGSAHTIISLWCRRYKPARAEQILLELLEWARNDHSLLPSFSAFAEVIQGWRDSTSEEAAPRAHAVLEMLIKHKRSHPEHFGDNLEELPFITCLELWAQSRNAEATSRVETILEWMEQAGVQLSCRTLLPAIPNLSASQATALFKRLHCPNEGDVALLVEVYENLLQRWASHQETDSAENAQKLLKEILAVPSSRESHERILRCFIYTVIALKASAVPEATQQIEALLDQGTNFAQESFQITGNPSILAKVSELWAHSALPSSTERAHFFFAKAVDHKRFQGIEPEVSWYESTIAAFVQCENATEAESFLQRARDDGIVLTSNMYMPLIKTYVHNGIGLQRATLLFDEMVGHFLEGNELAKPTRDAFGLLIASHASQRNTQLVQSLWRLLQRVQRRDPSYEEFYESFGLKSASDSVGRDASILYHMLTESKTGVAVEDSMHCFMDALTESSDPGSGRRAEGILLKMQEMFEDGVFDIEPTFETFQKVIDSWVDSKTDGCAGRADAVLSLAEELALEGHEKLQPDHRGYLSVITAWSTSHDEKAPDRISDLIRKMKKRYDCGDKRFVLNGTMYVSLIQAYANSGNPDAAKLAQRVFDTTPENFQDTQLYNALIGAQGGDAISAESILQEMHRGFLDGKEKIRPNTESFNKVIQAWSRSGSPMAAWRADGIFNRMNQLASTGRLPVKPNARTFDMVISTLANELGADAAFKVEHYLGLLKEFYRSGDVDCMPSVTSYTEAIRAWGSNLEDPRSVLRAKALLDEMHELARGGATSVRPDRETYSVYLQALAKSTSEQKEELAENVAAMMKFDGIVLEGHLLEYLQRCLLPSTAVLSGWTVFIDDQIASDEDFF